MSETIRYSVADTEADSNALLRIILVWVFAILVEEQEEGKEGEQ